MKIKLMATKNIYDEIIERTKGELINYYPWEFNWGGMTEPERRKKGLFIHCYGMGEFEVLELGNNVAIYPYCLYINYRKGKNLKRKIGEL